MGTKLLVIDDDPNICDLLRYFFENEGYEVKTANDGAQGVEFFKMYEPDIVLLDIMLPKKDGWAVCREIREVSSKPIIMITAKGEVFDKVLGLEMGADDFVVKPFDLKELAVRIKAVLRRCNSHENPSNEEVIKFENIEISLQKYELKLKGKSVDILPKELELLYFLASNYNRVFTRDQLLDKVWGFDYLGDSRTVDVHVKRLREKLEGVSDKWILKTVWGVGYTRYRTLFPYTTLFRSRQLHDTGADIFFIIIHLFAEHKKRHDAGVKGHARVLYHVRVPVVRHA